MKKENLKFYTLENVYAFDHNLSDLVTWDAEDVYIRDDVDSVILPLERRINRQAACIEMWKKVTEDLQLTNSRLRQSVKELEEIIKVEDAIRINRLELENEILKESMVEIGKKCDAEIDKLKANLENVQNTMATDILDANMENIKLKEHVKELESELKQEKATGAK